MSSDDDQPTPGGGPSPSPRIRPVVKPESIGADLRAQAAHDRDIGGSDTGGRDQGGRSGSSGPWRRARRHPHDEPTHSPSAASHEPADLSAERLLQRPSDVPESGWRRAVYSLSGGLVNPGESPQTLRRREIETRIAATITGRARFVPVLTRKGGVGKTTTTTLLGMTLATLRDDRIVAVDANPDRGTLAERVRRQSDATVRDLVEAAGTVSSFSDMSRLVSRDATRLDVIASDTDPAAAHAFGEEDYKIVADLAAQHYSIVLTDCGTGMVHSVMRGTLDVASSLVLVSGASVDEARLASGTLNWLDAHGHQRLVQEAVVALNTRSQTTTAIDVRQVADHFSSRCRAVVHIPYDPHLSEGSLIELGRLRPATTDAVLELAAHVVDGIRDQP